MNRTLRVAATLSLILAPVALAQSKRPMALSDIFDLKNVGAVALSPDASAVAFAVSAWEHPNAKPAPDTAKGDRHEVRSHLWLVSTAGGTPRQLTFSERGENAPA